MAYTQYEPTDWKDSPSRTTAINSRRLNKVEQELLASSIELLRVGGLIFIGTKEEYQTAYDDGNIKDGTIVVIVDGTSGGGSGGDTPTVETTSILGRAILGKMILGT